ncbi:MAG: 30S ribosomal protein S6 [Actinobacteria bacterium]|nr:30S ribosomal protein S6 [Actinomycetota bacterium]
MTRAYELMVIIDGGIDDNAAQQQVKSITATVTSVGGSVHGNPDWWGKRRLAYPINKREDGYYVVYNILAPPGALDEVERTLRIADNVVRHKLLRLPDHEGQRRGMLEKV